MLVWLGKVQIFIRINDASDLPEESCSQERQSYLLEKISEEIRFVHFYNILSSEHLTIYVVDEAQSSVRAK